MPSAPAFLFYKKSSAQVGCKDSALKQKYLDKIEDLIFCDINLSEIEDLRLKN